MVSGILIAMAVVGAVGLFIGLFLGIAGKQNHAGGTLRYVHPLLYML